MKILFLGDSPLAKTGFGRVNSRALAAFLAKGWTVASVTGMQTKLVETKVPLLQFNPSPDDPMGLARAVQLFENKEFEPDIIYATGDPGSISAIAQVVPAGMPFLAYVPIEGEPLLNHMWRGILEGIEFFTCSFYGAAVVKQSIGKDVDVIYHGVDKATFQPLSREERQAYRERLGWDGKFVVVCVAQNVRRKQLTRLIEAISIARYGYKEKDILLYLHTVPFQNHWLEGWNLPEVTQGFGAHEAVVFNPMMSEFGRAVPERGDMDVPGLVELVGASDLFVLPSQVEGFGLPIAEAMALGVPVAVTKYAAGWEVAALGGGTGINVRDWEIHKSGTKYANVDPEEIAKTIIALKRDPRKLARMKADGLAAAKTFDWSVFEEYVVAKIEEVIDRREVGNELSPEEGQGREEAGS